ncbi:MAG: 1,2-phenylacetyl-CoA epoxidase subunit PaaD [Actinomycetia bacterium]|nr:1,2-phenylacetyl-CoA epoxidase subunit PaaD [Actinomycetes bacterium]
MVTSDPGAAAEASEARGSTLDVEAAVRAVTDPEIPTLSIGDLGIVREVLIDEDGGSAHVVITPTYSGCPAMEVIARDVVDAAADQGYAARVSVSHHPPWTTDWMSETGRAALRQLDIAPPAPRGESGPVPVTIGRAPHTSAVPCPRCGSAQTEELARFGTTACKALHRCRACGDPFDEFKAV